eukprot:6105565-Amphidinium_carterae.2
MPRRDAAHTRSSQGWSQTGKANCSLRHYGQYVPSLVLLSNTTAVDYVAVWLKTDGVLAEYMNTF